MKLEYEATIDEAVAAHLRLMELSKTVRRLRRLGLLFVPLTFLLLYLTLPGEESAKLVFSIVAALVVAPLYLFFCSRFVRWNTRRLLVESLGTDEPVPSEYEFTEEGLVFRQMGTEIRFRWDRVIEVNERRDVLEFITENKGLALMPKRIFRDEGQMEEWLEFARRRASAS
ncbi:hypothetical protein GF402_03660 [Candidatus Fermentibacteria bacterium]|nr:hypothetical protein [Candidatus Fermentibacteria bacterium]